MGCTDCSGEEIDTTDRLVQAKTRFKRVVDGVTYDLQKGEEACVSFRVFSLLLLFVKEVGRCQRSSSED